MLSAIGRQWASLTGGPINEPILNHSYFKGVPRGRHPVLPFSRSKLKPHQGVAEVARRKRQLEKGTLQHG
jgi:hypothetical protein